MRGVLNGVMVASFLLAFSQTFAIAGSRSEPTRPNIIILLADDLGYGDLSIYGHPSIETPALDRLAMEGLRWTNFYAGAPVCSPSRGALMTGKLPVRSGLYGIKRIVLWPNAKGGIPASFHTIAEALKGVGYDTAMAGKWHLGDEPDALPTRHGFDYWMGTPYSNDQDWLVARDVNGLLSDFSKNFTPEERTRRESLRDKFQEQFQQAAIHPDQSSDWNVSLVRSYNSSSAYVDEVVERPAKQETLTKRYTEQAISFIKAHASGDRPFFLYVAYNMPHVPTFASEHFKGKSLGGSYGDAVEEIDWSAKEIRHALEEAGLAKSTLLIFASDNGVSSLQVGRGGSAGPLKGHKATTFEGGMRSPGIFWWPGRIKPAVVHGIGSLMDLYATALSLAGVTGVSNDIDSIDLSPVFEGKPSPRGFLEYFSVTGELLGYRNGAWKLSLTDNGRTLSNKAALYNLNEDPSELMDVSQVYPDIVKDLVNEAKKRDAALRRAAPIFDQI